MDTEQHYKEFMDIIRKYGLDSSDKADEIAHLLTDAKKGSMTPKEFSVHFGMTEHEAAVFLSWIEKGLNFKEKNIDPHKK